MSRIRFAALFATVAALAVVLAACGGGGGSSDEDPQTVLDNATVAGVESGTVDLQLGIKSTGSEGGDVKVSLSGPFQAGAKGQLPEFDLNAKADGTVGGEAIDFEGGLTLLGDRAFVGYNGTEYEVDPTTFGFVKSAFEQAQQKGGEETGDTTACQEAATELKIGEFIDNLKNEGSADVEGTSTTKVSGDLNVGAAIDAIIELTKDPACSAQFEAAGQALPLDELERVKGELVGAVKKAHADVYVGDDEIIRKLAAELTVEPKDSEKVEVDFEITLGEVNEEQSISAPANAKPLEGLFQELGVNPLELLEGGGSEGLGGLLEGLSGGEGGGSSGSSGGSGGQQEYVECLQGAETPTDLQKCASLLR